MRCISYNLRQAYVRTTDVDEAKLRPTSWSKDTIVSGVDDDPTQA